MKLNEADGDKNCTCSCGSLFTESENYIEPDSTQERRYTWLDSNGNLMSRRLTDYEMQLEADVEKLQDSLFSISSHYAKIQFRLSQIACATGNERLYLLQELQRVTCKGIEASRDNDELPTLMNDAVSMGDVRLRQQKIITQLRSRLTDLAEFTDPMFCNESDSSYNLRKCEHAEVGTSCEFSHMEHDKYCACIVCRETRGYPKLHPSQLGYLSEVWPYLGDSDDDCCVIRQKKKSKKTRNKRKGKKLNKLFKGRTSRTINPSLYYSMPNEIKSPGLKYSSGAYLGRTLREKSQQISLLNNRSAGRLQGPLFVHLNGERTFRRRTQSESAVRRRSPESHLRIKPTSVTNTARPDRRSLESFSSAAGRGRSLGPKKPQLSMKASRNLQGAIPFPTLSRSRTYQRKISSSQLLSGQENRRSSKKLSDRMSTMSLQTQNQENSKKNNIKEGIRRSSFFGRLSKRWNKKSSKKTSVDENEKMQYTDESRRTKEKSLDADDGSDREGSTSSSQRMRSVDRDRYDRRTESVSKPKGSVNRRTYDTYDYQDDERYSRSPSQRAKQSTQSIPPSYRMNQDTDEDQRRSKRANSSRMSKKSNETDPECQSLRSYKWKQPLYSYSNQNVSCKKDCGGNCTESGKCARIRDCFKQYEKKQSRVCNSVIRRSVLGYTQGLGSLRLVPRFYRDLHQNPSEISRKRWGQPVPRNITNREAYDDGNQSNSRDGKRNYHRNCFEDSYNNQKERMRSNRPRERPRTDEYKERTERKIYSRIPRNKPQNNMDEYRGNRKRYRKDDQAPTRASSPVESSYREPKRRENITIEELDRYKKQKRYTDQMKTMKTSSEEYNKYRDQKKTKNSSSEEFNKYRDQKKTRKNPSEEFSRFNTQKRRKDGSVTSRTDRGWTRGSSQEFYKLNRKESKRGSNNKPTSESNRLSDQRTSNRSSIGSKRDGESKRTSKESRRKSQNFHSEEMDKYNDQRYSARSSTSSRKMRCSGSQETCDRRGSRNSCRSLRTGSTGIRKEGESKNEGDRKENIPSAGWDNFKQHKESIRNGITSRRETESSRSSKETPVKQQKDSRSSRRSWEYPDNYRHTGHSKRASAASKRSQASIRSRASSEGEQSQRETPRSSKENKRASDRKSDKREHQHPSQRTSTASNRRDHGSVQIDTQNVTERTRMSTASSLNEWASRIGSQLSVLSRTPRESRRESQRSGKVSRRASERKSDKSEHQGQSQRTSTASGRRDYESVKINNQEVTEERRRSTTSSQRGWTESIPDDELFVQREERRSVKVNKETPPKPRTSYAASQESSPQSLSVESAYRRESKTPAPSPFSTRSMVEMTTNIERDNTNRTLKSHLVCQSGQCRGKCTKNVQIVECPFKQAQRKSVPTEAPQTSCQCSRNRSVNDQCFCVRSQSANYQLTRPFSYHSMLELPLAYPQAIKKPRKVKCEPKVCRTVKDRKNLVDFICSKPKIKMIKCPDMESPKTSVAQANLPEDPSVFKDAQTDC